MSRLIIDFSVIAHKSFHCMFSDNYEPQVREEGEDERGRPFVNYWTESEEFARNCAMNMLFLKTLYKPDDIIVCMDAPSNWRAEYVRNWYHERLEVFEQLEGNDRPTFYVTFDLVEYRITYVSQTDTWVINKPKSSEKRDLTLEYRTWSYNEIKDEDVWIRAIANRVPYYKGKRKNSVWKAVTPKHEFKKLTEKLAFDISELIGAKAIMVDNAEGDDVVYGAVIDSVGFDPNEQVTVVSIDQDLYQLSLSHPNLVYYNPNLGVEIPMNRDVIRLKLLHKILGGDSSDNIMGVSLPEAKAKLPTVAYDEHGVVKSGLGTDKFTNSIIDKYLTRGKAGIELFKPAYKDIEEFYGDDESIETFYRNVMLVYLANTPEEIHSEILRRVLNDVEVEKTLEWVDFGVSGKDKISVINKAKVKFDELLAERV